MDGTSEGINSQSDGVRNEIENNSVDVSKNLISSYQSPFCGSPRLLLSTKKFTFSKLRH
jgi:hypothetical protein